MICKVEINEGRERKIAWGGFVMEEEKQQEGRMNGAWGNLGWGRQRPRKGRREGASLVT